MPNIKNIEPGQTYLFYVQTPHQEEDVLFKATFIGINGISFQCKNVECKDVRSYHNCGSMSMPLAWIRRVEDEPLLLTDILLSEPTDFA